MRKRIVTGLVACSLSLTMLAGLGGSVSAGNAGDGSGYSTQPGFAVATANTPCAGHGAFGAFGKDFNLGNETSGHGGQSGGPGTDGTQTGLNNGTLCGNRQGNL